MPYYVYAVRPFGQLHQMSEHAAFKEASLRAKALRAVQAPGVVVQFRVMFAQSAVAAEDLLLAVRDPAPPGDD